MSQGIIAGATDYSIQSIDDIKTDIENWIKYGARIRKEFQETIQDLTKIGYWDNVPYNYRSFCEEIPTLCDTFESDFNIVLSAIRKDRITRREITLMENICNIAHGSERELVSAYKDGDYRWKRYGDSNFAKAEALYQHIRDYFVTLFDVDNAAGRMEHYMKDEATINNSIHAENSIIIGNENEFSNSSVSLNREKKEVWKWLSEHFWCPIIVAIIAGVILWLLTGT